MVAALCGGICQGGMAVTLYGCQDGKAQSLSVPLLAWSVRQEWGLSELPGLSRGRYGKPFFPALPHCHFNISHSGGLVLCALDSEPVGVDVECVRPHHPRLADRICSAEEQAWLAGQEDREQALSVLWTMKESRVKYTGSGLTVPIRQIRVPLPPPRSHYAVVDGLIFRMLEGNGWAACVCGHSSCGPIRWVSAQQLASPEKNM